MTHNRGAKHDRSEGASADRRIVVFVDDDPAYLSGVRRLLARYVDVVQLVAFSNAESAVAYVLGHPSDLVVLDAFMPGLGGIEACSRLRASGVTGSLTVVSSDVSSDLERAAFAAGATRVLAKPIEWLRLLGLARGAVADLDEQQQLVVRHMEVARNIARALARRYAQILALEDVIGPAMVGLCEAATRFDRSRAEPFIAFAERRIRGSILDEIRRLGAHGRVVHKRQRQISEVRRALTQGGDEPTDERVAEHLGLSVSAVRDASERAVRAKDAEAEIQALPSHSASPEACLERAQRMSDLARARATLTAQEATIIRLHYDEGMSLAQVARSLGLSLGRVRHLHATGLARLRGPLCEDIAADGAERT